MSDIAFVYGNGESRRGWDINQQFEGVLPLGVATQSIVMVSLITWYP